MSTKFKFIILLLFLVQAIILYWAFSDNQEAQEVELLPYKAYLENPLAVKSMDLSNLGLEEIIVDLSQFQNLEYLNLSDNSLQDIPKSLLKLPKLKTLLLANNGLSLPNNLIFYDNESIERLDLSNNYFSEITGAHCIPCLKNLKYLNLNGNNIQVMPDFTATEIDTILLQKNSIYDVSNISLRLPIKHIVKYLDLSNNEYEFEDFDNIVILSKKCTAINLSGNKLHFPYEFFISEQSNQLKSINLSNCNFINYTLNPLPENEIETLDLSNSNLFLSGNLFEKCTKLKYLDISGVNMYNFDLMSFGLIYLSIDLERETYLLLPELKSLNIHSKLGKDILLFSDLGIKKELLGNLNLPSLRRVIIRDHEENGLEELIKVDFPNVQIIKKYSTEAIENNRKKKAKFHEKLMESIENKNQ